MEEELTEKKPEGEILPEQKQEEEMVHLKRQEIKTMAKDVAFIREKEARKEREKITQLDSRQAPPAEKVRDIETEIKTATPPETEEQKREKVFSVPKPFKKTSFYKKLWVRALFVFFFVIFLVLGGYFLWSKFKSPEPEEYVPLEEEKPEEEPEQEVELIIPTPHITVQKTIIFESFKEALQEDLDQNALIQLVLENVPENRVFSLEEVPLPEVFGIELLQEVYPKLTSDYSLILYSQTQGIRPIFITQVKKSEGLIPLFQEWESSVIENGIISEGENISPLASSFKTSSYNGIGFRYLTISREDWGVCYAYFENYLVITSSFEGMKKTIDGLESQEIDKDIGQLFIVGFNETSLTPQLESFFKKYRPGGVLLLSRNIQDQNQLKALIADLQNLSMAETGLPLFIAVDQEGGPISRVSFLEEKTAQSEIENPEQAFVVGEKRGQELKSLGINLNLAPLLDLLNPGDFIFDRGFQKSAEEIGELGKRLVEGQKTAGILTAIKHFPGYGSVVNHPEESLAEVETIPEITQFQKAMEAEPELVMTANVIYQDIDSNVPFTFSENGIQLLKNRLDANALIISDDLDQNSLLEKYSLKEITTKPIKAGTDLMIFSGWRSPVENGLDAFLSAFQSGEISKTTVREAVSKIIKFKNNL